MSRQHDDQVLIERWQRGDRSAFNALIRGHETKAYQYAYRLTRDQELAADVVAEAFVRVLNALPNFKSQSTFSTWLYRIVTNCYLDLRKKERLRKASSLDTLLQTDEGEMARQIESSDESPQEQAERMERERRMEEALDLLPDYQRAMIIMYHAEMLTYEEISAALDLPIGTVKSRLNRARLSLREILLREGELFRI
jgi:RNA polymerase sigma-70 factor (ECF subfamily)